MTIKTKVTFKEYLRLIFHLAYDRTILKILICVAMLILLWIIFYYLNFFNLPKPVIYQYITLVLIMVVQSTIIYITILRNYLSSNHLRESLKIEITHEEIKITGESFYMEVQMEKFYKIVERENWFLLYQNTLSAIIIAKKDMSKKNIIKFREILRSLSNVPVKL